MIDRARAIDAATWLKVAGWGMKSKALHWKLPGIAWTMREYAIGGWQRSPSAKQAEYALEALEAARNAGVIGLATGPSPE